MQMIDHKKAYDIQEAAALLDLTPQTVRGYLKKGKIKYFITGARYYIVKEDLQEFIRGKT